MSGGEGVREAEARREAIQMELIDADAAYRRRRADLLSDLAVAERDVRAARLRAWPCPTCCVDAGEPCRGTGSAARVHALRAALAPTPAVTNDPTTTERSPS